MKIARRIALPLLVVVLVFGGALVLTWAQAGPPARLPGITAEDEHPNGCVSCHAQSGDNDYRLNVSVNAISGHPPITAIVKTIPKDCGVCHRPNVPAGPINTQTHKIHYENPSENVFVTVYKGQCLECHALNTATGAMSIKQGPKNW